MIFTSIARGIFECIGDSKEVYTVDIENETCNCKSWILGNNRPCKHLRFFEVKNV